MSLLEISLVSSLFVCMYCTAASLVVFLFALLVSRSFLLIVETNAGHNVGILHNLVATVRQCVLSVRFCAFSANLNSQWDKL
jgi:hypothetical protein